MPRWGSEASRRRAIAAAHLFVASLAGAVEARADPAAEGDRSSERNRMVEKQIRGRGVENERVLDAMRRVPRHQFVPLAGRREAYDDHPVSIGYGQTISQPYIVAVMTELLDPKPGQRVLEIGTGSGYQAAVLSLLAKEVYTIEIVPELAARAKEDLARLGYGNVVVVTGDGYRGLPDQAPFDGIVVTAAPETVPKPLVDQLRIGGRIVIPVGSADQKLKVIERTKDGVVTRTIFDVRFVPMTGEAAKKKP